MQMDRNGTLLDWINEMLVLKGYGLKERRSPLS